MMSGVNIILFTLLLSTVAGTDQPCDKIPDNSELPFDVTPNEEIGEILERYHEEEEEGNPEEMGSYFEGDIMVDSEEDARNALSNVKLWDDAVVPYEMSKDFEYTGLTVIYWAMRKIQQKTCIRFRPKTDSDTDYLVLTKNKTGCWSHIGRQGGAQLINLQEPACLRWKRRGTVVHELMHALGVTHEHTRPDRDDFIHILFDNVRSNRIHNFEKSKNFASQVMPYDYGSLMHYSLFAFTKQKRKFTLRPKITEKLMQRKDYNFRMGQRINMSKYDIMRLNAIYCQSKRRGLLISIWTSLTSTMFPV